MKRLMAVLAALLVAATTFLASPASAAGFTRQMNSATCQSYDTILQPRKTCLFLEWRMQGDYSGVALNYYQITTPDGCSALESDNGGTRRYDDTKIMWFPPDFIPMTRVNRRYGACAHIVDTKYDDRFMGEDTGSMKFRISIKARQNNLADIWLCWGVELKSTGDYTVYFKNQWSATDDTNSCTPPHDEQRAALRQEVQ